MTEAEWLSAANPQPMLAFLADRISARRSTLLGVACRRQLAKLDSFPESVMATDAAERRADGAMDDAEWDRVCAAIAMREDFVGRTMQPDPNAYPPNDRNARYSAVLAAFYLVESSAPMLRATRVLANCYEAIRFSDRTPFSALGLSALSYQVAMVRDIFGNPFRPVSFDPRWRTEDTVGLAHGIYEDRAFNREPLLSDALMDAGCDDEQVLSHCRGEGPHVRGCWVVDLILGKT